MRNRYFLITCLVLAFNIYAIAQVTTADVLGRVTDTCGAALPGVMVVIENLGTGATRTVVSDRGDYVFNLLPGSCQITTLLVKGGMGEVYPARDTKLKSEVAIKILSDEFSREFHRVSRFRREAEVLASL